MKQLLKKLALSASIAIVALELLCAAAYRVRQGRFPYGLHELPGGREVLTVDAGERSEDILAIHPYLGFVYNPDHPTPFHGCDVSAFGYYSTVAATHRRSSTDEFIVGFFGGSVAAHAAVRGGETLRRTLQECGALRGRRVTVNAVSQGGFKQPQQMLALTYYLAQGAEFDLVVNLDGVNEMVWTLQNVENQHIDPTYPYCWPALLGRKSGTSTAYTLAYADVIRTRERTRQVGRWLDRTGFYRTGTGALIWRSTVVAARKREEALSRALQKGDKARRAGRPLYAVRGPGAGARSDRTATLQKATDLWRESSLLMHQVSRARGIPYLHLLQPNQYFPGSKPLSRDEAEKFVREDSIYARALPDGYPLLQQAGRALADAGVDFVDSSRAFADHAEDLYEDDCCHYNQRGNDILAAAVGREICRALEQAK